MSDNLQDAVRTAARPLPAVRLVEHGDHWLAVPQGPAAGGTPYSPFVLPRVPASLVHWLTVGGARVWGGRRRCVAALLLVGCRTGRWTVRLPRQRCGADAACWTAAADDLPPLPDDARVAGTFQTRLANPGDDLADAVPPVHGVHLVQGVGAGYGIAAGGPAKVWTFVRAGGGGGGDWPRAVGPDRVIADDWAEAVDEAMPHLRLD
jgi:hypothetical protein